MASFRTIESQHGHHRSEHADWSALPLVSGDQGEGRHRSGRPVPRHASCDHVPRLFPRRRAGAFRRSCADHRGNAAVAGGRAGAPVRSARCRAEHGDRRSAARQGRSGRRRGRDPAVVGRMGREARQCDGGVLEGCAVSHARCRRMAAGAPADGRRVRFPAGLSDPAAARRSHRADAGACNARRAAARRRHPDRISGEHVGAERPAHLPLRCAAEDPRRRWRARAGVCDRGVGISEFTSCPDFTPPASGRHPH